MTAAARAIDISAGAVNELDVFELRAWARGFLWSIGEYELAEAVDQLQRDAQRDGLIERIGQDAVQQIIAAAFATFRAEIRAGELLAGMAERGERHSGSNKQNLRGSRAATPVTPKLSDIGVSKSQSSVGSLWDALNEPRRFSTPQSTIKAVVYCVRTRGIAALKEPANVERLSRCDDAARAEIKRRIAKLREQS